MEQTLQQIFEGIVVGDRTIVQEKVEEAIDTGLDAAVILNDGMIAAMAEVGRRFEYEEYYMPEMLIAARAMQDGLAILKPHLQQAEVKSVGKVIAGTVHGDLHDIGKNLVCMMFEGAGFEIQDLGVNVLPEGFVDAVRSGGVDIVAMSALLTTTMPNMKVTIEALDEAGLRSKVKVIVGGAPLTESYAQQIGADGYAPDASRAVTLAKSLME
jgi:5-methyltetrahydrofolate--homocysteine methyltransferase